MAYDSSRIQISATFVPKTLKCKRKCECNWLKKRYFKKDQHLAQLFKYYVECLSSSHPFPCSQIIIPFLNLIISTNQQKVL